MTPALFASDFDGTLAFSGRIHRSDLEAAEHFRCLGGRFGICSGRDPGSLEAELTPYRLPMDFRILMGGAWIEAEGRRIEEHPLCGWQELLPLLRERCRFFTVVGAGQAYLEQKPDLPPPDRGDRCYLDSLRRAYALDRLPDGPVYQISCRAESEKAAVELAGEISCGTFDAVPNCDYVDITPFGVGKAAAVGAVAVYFGIPEDRIFTAGDGRNDIEMLSRYRSFAMRSSEPCVRQSAGRTVGSLAEALRAAERMAPL